METTKDKVLAALEQNKGTFLSGGSLAEELGISRNSVWKTVRALESEGYSIESVTGKGYMLAADTSKLSAASINHYLTASGIELEYHETIDSTNTRAKKRAGEGAPEGLLVVASEQTAGRGRQGRAFFSPKGSGIYFSLLLKPTLAFEHIPLITTFAAVCVAQTIDEVLEVNTQIKWVNDIFYEGHKAAGILTEASLDAETAHVNSAVLGIGINVFEPEEGFPQDLGGIAHGISSATADTADIRARLVAGIVNRFMAGYETIPAKTYLAEYRKRSLLDGRHVHIYVGSEDFMATVEGVDDDFRLHVKLDTGEERVLSSGEVHIPSSQLVS